MALLMVLGVVAVACVLGYVMLSTATLANRTGGNQLRLISADYLGESGINLALYYLQNPPSGDPLDHWTGTGGAIPVGDGGTINVLVTRDGLPSDWTYEITCEATAGNDSQTRITRLYSARVKVRTEFQAKRAAAFNTDVTVPGGTTVDGDVYTTGHLALTLGSLVATLNGNGYCASYMAGSSFGVPTWPYEFILHTGPATVGSPTVTNVNNYRTYWHDDVLRDADVLTSSSLASVEPVPSSGNPGRVWYYDASLTPLTLGDNVKINGTLVVDKGDLLVRGRDIEITPQAGYPALIVYRDLDVAHPTLVQTRRSLRADGLVFVGRQLKRSGTTPALPTNYSRLTINGGLLMGTLGGGESTDVPFATGYNIITNVTYEPDKAKAPEITGNPVLRVPKGVTILRWGSQ